MAAAGIAPADMDAWVADAGSPKQYSFMLEFHGATFSHSEETPDMSMQVGESGTFTFEQSRLVNTVGEPGNIDTTTYQVDLTGDSLTLQYLDSTETGTAEDLAKHRLYAYAFYCSAAFIRQN